MLKEINSGLGKFFTRDKIIIIVILFVLGYVLMAYSGFKSMRMDGMSDGSTPSSDDSSAENTKTQPTVKETSAQNYVQPPSGMNPSQGYTPYDTANPKDLLPNDANNEWSQLNPVSNNGGVVMPDLLRAGAHIGLDTIGQTLRNANQQLRSDPIIPKQDVGPWMQSTIEPDLARAPLEIGS